MSDSGSPRTATTCATNNQDLGAQGWLHERIAELVAEVDQLTATGDVLDVEVPRPQTVAIEALVQPTRRGTRGRCRVRGRREVPQAQDPIH